MFLKPHQMYLESQELYQEICRLAQIRTQIKALNVEEDQLVQHICEAMCPATEIVDLVFLRAQKGASEKELQEMFVARWQECEQQMDVHPAYVSDRFRPGNNKPDIPIEDPRQMPLFPTDYATVTTENDEERESPLPPAPPTLKEKEEEREACPKKKKAEAQKDDAPVVVTDDTAAPSTSTTTTTSPDAINTTGFITFFNDTMKAANAAIPPIQSLRGLRLTALQARCKEYGKDAVVQVIQLAANSPFLNGKGRIEWRASIDWILKPNNFPKILEGLYSDVQRKKGAMSPERIAMIHEEEQRRHEELQKRLDEQRRTAVSYEEYVRLRDSGQLNDNT